MMSLSEVSAQLRKLSDDYASQRIFVDEYRLKRKHLLDGIDETFNHQQYEKIPRGAEKTEEPDSVDSVLPETINNIFKFDKKGDDIKP